MSELSDRLNALRLVVNIDDYDSAEDAAGSWDAGFNAAIDECIHIIEHEDIASSAHYKELAGRLADACIEKQHLSFPTPHKEAFVCLLCGSAAMTKDGIEHDMSCELADPAVQELLEETR